MTQVTIQRTEFREHTFDIPDGIEEGSGEWDDIINDYDWHNSPIYHAEEVVSSISNDIKGAKNGLCNRTACQEPGAIFFNHSTEKYYCSFCATKLNNDPCNRKDAQRLYGHDLCTLED